MNKLEERVAAVLRNEGEAIPESGRMLHVVEQAAREAQKSTRRAHRLRAGFAVVSLVAAGIGVVQFVEETDKAGVTNVATGQEQPASSVVATADQYDPNFRLRPTWLPPGTPKGLYIDSTKVTTQMSPGSAVVWAKGEQRASLTAIKVYGDFPKQSLSDALAETQAQTAAGATGVLLWWANQPELDYNVQLVAQGLVVDDLIRLTTQVRVDNNAQIQPIDPPPGFTEVYKGAQTALQPTKSVTIVFVGSAVQIEGVRIEGLAAEMARAGAGATKPLGTSMVVRGIAGRVDGKKLVSWTERGWTYRVQADDVETALKIANSLGEATEDEWAALTKIPLSDVPKNGAPGFDIAPQSRTLELFIEGETTLSIRVPGKTDSCMSVRLLLNTTDETVCIDISEKRLMWSKTVVVNDQRFLIAVLNGSVDAIAAASAATSSQEASVSVFDENVYVPTSELIMHQGEFVLVGFVAVPIGEGVTEVNLFTADPGAPVDDANPAIEPTDEEPASTLRIVERVPVS
jgi:hypothetical protein